MAEIELATAAGRLVGRRDGGIDTYLGVPYAAPPTGGRRYAVPAPVRSWEGVRRAIEPGPSAPQRGSERAFGMDMVAVTDATWRRGGDYLTANVWAPVGATKLPVFLYIHGGGLVIGTKDAAVYSGANFARDGVVAVNLNYRLGAEGFLPISGAPTNLGLRDMLAGLRWVRDNIEAFGGDPDNVTVGGESGGGIAVACLLTSPLAAGLFHRATIQSGHGSAVYPIDIARRTVTRMAQTLKIDPTRSGFLSATPEATVAALTRVSRPGRVELKDAHGYDPSFGLGVINPVWGDDVLPRHPLDALRDGAAADIDLLIGTTAEEARFWFGPTRLESLPRPAARWLLSRMAPQASELFNAYAKTYPGERGGRTMTRALTDLSFRYPARQYALAHQGSAHVYEFDWRSTAAGGRLGSAHGLDLGFVFDTLPTVSGPRGMAGNNPPQALADHTHRIWLDFIRSGQLPWTAFTAADPTVYQLTTGRAVREQRLPAADYLPDRARAIAP
ncbi:carboxylesterase family protein [Tersicoccus sp. MR15.9]|uniref:carboxylesterase/lipase family protein n=1 Tax=Tersicoccus mangrovi TaxID=3121635 RepID=UPI002FE667B4